MISSYLALNVILRTITQICVEYVTLKGHHPSLVRGYFADSPELVPMGSMLWPHFETRGTFDLVLASRIPFSAMTPHPTQSHTFLTSPLPSMAKKRKRPAPSQTEIWDDTALVRSWNEAVEEYEVRSFPFSRLDVMEA